MKSFKTGYEITSDIDCIIHNATKVYGLPDHWMGDCPHDQIDESLQYDVHTTLEFAKDQETYDDVLQEVEDLVTMWAEDSRNYMREEH